MSRRISYELNGTDFEIKFSKKYNLLAFSTIALAFSNLASFMIGGFNYDINNPLFYSPIITMGLTIFFAVWFMITKDIEEIQNGTSVSQEKQN